MPYSLIEFDAPHQSHPEAQTILKKVLTEASEAGNGDVVALGFPVKVYCKENDAEYDSDYPLPEVMVVKNGRLTLGSDEDFIGNIQPDVIKWVRLCKENPDNIRGGLELAKKICDDGAQDEYPCRIMVWYFSDFISATIWHPAVGHFGFGRSLKGSMGMTRADFAAKCERYKKICSLSSEVLSSHRNHS